MFKSKSYMIALFGVLIIATALIVLACEGDEPESEFYEAEPEEKSAETDPKEVDAKDVEPEPGVDQAEPEEKSDEIDPEEADAEDKAREEINGDPALMLPPTARILAASPGGDYLLFTIAAAPIDPYQIINTETYEGEICDERGSYWGEIEDLPTPGLELAQVKAPHFSPDGEELLYVGYEIKEYKYVSAAIYLCELGLPPEIEHQIDPSEDEFIQGIRPAWNAEQRNIYYLTAKGVMSYCSENQQSEKLHQAQKLKGLVQDDTLAPHAFHVKDDFAELAYFYEGKIKLVAIENDQPELEVFDTGLSDINNIEFIFDGRYLSMESYYMYDIKGYWLEFFDRQTGELVELENDYLPAGYSTNDQEKMAFIKFNEPNDYEISILNDSLEKVQSVDIPWLTGHVIWLDDVWCVLGRNQEGYPLYKVDFD